MEGDVYHLTRKLNTAYFLHVKEVPMGNCVVDVLHQHIHQKKKWSFSNMHPIILKDLKTVVTIEGSVEY